MASKYGKLLADKPRIGATELSLDRVAVLKHELQEEGFTTTPTIAKLYADLRAEKDELEEQVSKAALRLEAAKQLLVDHMESDGITSLRLDTGRVLSTWVEPYVNVQDPEAFRLWCIEQGLERKMVLHHSTTASLVKERLQAGEPEPPGIMLYAKSVLRLGS
jgi:hypothetical protein